MNRLDSTSRRLVRDPIKRRAWVKYQVQLQGRSMAQVAEAAGVDRRTLYSAFLRPYPRMEHVIATAIGLRPQELFPERYDADGLPNRRMGRPAKKSAVKHTEKARAGNVSVGEAA